VTLSAFNESIYFDLTVEFPLLTTRKIFYDGVLGELAAFVRGPKHLDDFKKWGCNYWGPWANEDGSIDIDYGNKWIDWRGYNQLEALVQGLKEDPNGRRHMMTSWAPENVLGDRLSLPCCHHTYQFYVRRGFLDMHWIQRSTDVMIGLPSDAVLAAAMTMSLAKEVGLMPGEVMMTLGDTHIYALHMLEARELLERKQRNPPRARYTGSGLTDFDPTKLRVDSYNPNESLKFEVIA